ncbi:MAG: LOG family protein [Deltaproteobacteria bacterium]|nr:LOG family protein [Deltaproteobacteria bacterium]
MHKGKKVAVVFGSSSIGEGSPHWELAVRIGREAARRGCSVANGGYGGVMEASHKGAREVGGDAVAVVSEDLGAAPNSWASETIVVGDWFLRFRALLEIADVCFVLYGGLGTLNELFAAWNLVRIDKSAAPVVLVGPQWKDALGALGIGGEAGAAPVEWRPGDGRLVTVCDTAEEAARVLDAFGAPR